MNKPMLLKVNEVAEILRIQRAKVYLLLEEGSLEGNKIGNAWRIRTDSVEKMVGDVPLDMFQVDCFSDERQER